MGANKNQGSNWIRRTTRIRLYQRDAWSCGYCGALVSLDPEDIRRKATLDHVDCNHANNAHNNLLTCCYSCNSSRKNNPNWRRKA